MRPLMIAFALLSSFGPAAISPANAQRAEQSQGRYDQGPPAPPHALQPVPRARFDSAIVHMFSDADVDGDGLLTIADFPDDGFAPFGAPPHFPPPHMMPGQGFDPAFAMQAGDFEDHLLRDIIEPIHPMMLIATDLDDDGAVSLEEMLSYQQTRFHLADRNEDCVISMEEARGFAFADGMHRPSHGPAPHRTRPQAFREF